MRLARLLSPLAAVALSLSAAACGEANTVAPDEPRSTPTTVEAATFAPSLGVDLAASGWTRTSTGVYHRTLAGAAATAPLVAPGQTVTVRYTGWLANGRQFDTGTFAFQLGAGRVVPGFEQGVLGMRVGERRRVLIPSALGYGPQGNGPTIPPNSVLVFDVEVVSAG